MKVILKEEVKGLGKKGQLVDAKIGYARNFLFPRNLAIEANAQNMEIWEKEQEELRKKLAAEIKEANILKEKIEKEEVMVKAKAGNGDRIFGSVTSQEIADSLNKKLGTKIDKKKIEIKDSIKMLGYHTVTVRVYPEITASLKVLVEKA